MMRKFPNYFADNKYRLTLFMLLGGATVFSVAIWRLRSEYTHSLRFGFLVWNLFLAWIPFLIAYLTYSVKRRRPRIYIIVPIAAFFWLIFFPNAPYILTDFQHLAAAGSDLPVWYDVMMLLWFSFTGLLLGIVSLFLMQEIVRREMGRWAGWGFVLVVACLSSGGIYVGRFLRWNSWDVLLNPGGLALHTLESLRASSLQSLGFTALFTAFFLFLYITLYAFGHLLLERHAGSNTAE